MAKFRDRTCIVCGDIQYNTATLSDTCIKCYAKLKRDKRIAAVRAKLEEMYADVSGPEANGYSKNVWTFTHSCGTRQTWTFGNILKRLREDPSNVPCSHCGGKRRVSKAMAAFIAKYGITKEQLVIYERYRKKVRHLTEKTYNLHKAEINPQNLPRGMHTNHLDHKVPIIEGFKQGIEPEVMARKENLQMLPAKVNLSKGRRSP